MKPSPRDFTSKPRYVATLRRTMSLWPRSTRWARRSPNLTVNRVKPSISLNRMVTVPSGAVCERKSGRSDVTAEATESIDVLGAIEGTPCNSNLRSKTRSIKGRMPSSLEMPRDSSCKDVALATSRSPFRW